MKDDLPGIFMSLILLLLVMLSIGGAILLLNFLLEWML